MTIKPINYDLTFEPDLQKFTFRGKEILTFEIVKPTRKIELDAIDLKITSTQLLLVNKNNISSFKVDGRHEKLVFNFFKELKSGEYQLSIEFEGILNDKLAGFYRSKYIVNGKKKYLATTQFEAADARRAFPCKDHPSYKATFDISLIIDKNLTAISNTLPIKYANADRSIGPNSTYEVVRGLWQGEKKGKKLVVFETTPLMSTYLLYVGVGEFEFLQDKYKDVLLRVVTTPGKSKYGKFALDCTKKFLKYYEDYFDYPYPLKKLDLLAIPDFASGAMENWGAITFRENALLLYPGLSSKVTMQRIAEVVAHELVHQWFGNLVTMKWWDDLWLNESFATYMAYKALDQFWPEWNVWSDYLSNSVFGALSLDGMKSTRSIHAEILNTKEIDENFDEIAYEKGGSILRMIDEYLGYSTFREGLRNYVKKFTYENAEAHDLWESLQKVSDKPVVKIMQKFILQKGFPLVEVYISDKKISIKQHRFFFLDFTDKNHWFIPTIIKFDSNKEKRIVIEKEQMKFEFAKDTKRVLLNTDYASFFISKYENKLLHQLGEDINNLNELESMGLIHDLFSLCNANKFDLDEYLLFIERYLKKENRIMVVEYLIGKLVEIYRLVKKEKIKELIIYFSTNAVEMTGYDPVKGEDIHTTSLRNISLTALNLLDNQEIKNFMIEKFEEFLKDGKLQPDLRATVYAGVVWSDDKYYDAIKKLYEESQTQEEKVKLLMALGNSKSNKVIEKSLNYGLEGKVRFSDLLYLIAATARNQFGKELTYTWLVKNWNGIIRRTGGHSTVLIRRFMQMIIPTGAIKKVDEVVNFLDENKITGLERTYEQVIEELKINVRFVNRYKND